MIRWDCDENGVPILSLGEIEERSAAFLRYFAPECLEVPAATPLASIADRLRLEHGVTIDFATPLGYAPDGAKYLGRFYVASKTICVDPEIMDPDPRFRFTLAHELGHFVFHRELKPSAFGGSKLEINDSATELLINRATSTRPQSWIEWQANVFAASLLMPRATVRLAVERQQSAMGVARRLGSIYVSDNASSHRDYEKIVEVLCAVYEVSQQSLRIRLEELNLVYRELPKGLLAISDILPGVLSNWPRSADER